ncbi:Diaminopimelate epimerase-like protein [Pholiota conissans]|uniref:Diaminopimelate epimerase-like protein n=1 Tax=Pholiota conissans TaxID=109636 RepID=A0A9P5Z2L4_9AGAR|nr:Diaminopimelate epimerase-like protein [Pholiota conissans]
MAARLNFTTLDVFTSQHFAGNPLAIVCIPQDFQGELSQTQKQTIAREFNLSETVFLHEGDINEPIAIDIFTTDEELPFAGHPTVGSGWYLLSKNPGRDRITLKTKAGEIPVFSVGSTGDQVRLRVPTNFKTHPPHAHPRAKVLQPQLVSADYANGLEGAEVVVSIVKGMTFLLVQLNSEDALSRLQPSPERLTVPGLGEWDGFVGLYAFYEREDGVIRTRMFDGTLEDPATGSAASTLGGWLAKKRGPGTHKIEILQGVEMGRRSEIVVVVDIGQDGEILSIELSGSAVEVMEGTVRIP